MTARGEYTLSTLVDGRLKQVPKDVVFRVVSSKVVEVPCEYADRLK